MASTLRAAVPALVLGVGLAVVVSCTEFEDSATPGGADAGQATSASSSGAASSASSSSGEPDNGDAGGSGEIFTKRALAYRQAVLSDEPLAYWRCNEAPGATGVVRTVTSDPTFDAKLTGATPPTVDGAGLFGSASGSCIFTGTEGQRLTVEAAIYYPQFTAEAWVQTNDIDAVVRHLFFISTGSGSFGVYLQNNVIFENVTGGQKTSAQRGAPLLPATWHHVVVIARPALELWIDGESQTEMEPATEQALPEAEMFSIGARTSTAPALKASVTEIAIYKSALAMSAVLKHHRIGSGTADE